MSQVILYTFPRVQTAHMTGGPGVGFKVMLINVITLPPSVTSVVLCLSTGQHIMTTLSI